MNHYLLQHGPTTSYSKVIKGEIHNVLATFKSSEQLQHPEIVSSLRQLNEDLTLLEFHRSRSKKGPYLECMLYVPPFCMAISSPEVGAAVTGACITALNKFLLYGFLDPSVVRDAKDGITSIARCIWQCSFEETEAHRSKRRSNFRHSTLTSITKRSILDKSNRNLALAKKEKYVTNSAALEITDEEVVLKLLNLASLTIRSPAGIQLLDSEQIVGIFDTCAHVATKVENTASELLKSAAADCLASIVLVVFGAIPVHRREFHIQIQHNSFMDDMDHSSHNSDASDDLWGESDPTLGIGTQEEDILSLEEYGGLEHPINKVFTEKDEKPAFITIMGRLASFVDPNRNSDRVVTQALRFINIALETASTEFLSSYPDLLVIMKNMLCKHLLYLSTTSDLVILCQVGRTIFNLFNSIKHHLKVQLEVFLTSVHLRILDVTSTSITSAEQKEIALESLLEFCHEPSLMSDLYVNYDCDVQCSNLFENICRVLTLIVTSNDDTSTDTDDHISSQVLIPSNLQNLACEGILVIIDSIARRCDGSIIMPENDCASLSLNSNVNSDTSNDSLVSEDTESITSEPTVDELTPPVSGNMPSLLDGARLQTSQIFLERKQKKIKIAKVTAKFNRKPFGNEWIAIGENNGIFPKPATPKSIAQFLYSTPMLDKSHIGEYISKGPAEKYVFNKKVLDSFVSMFDFSGMTFSDALRAFLLKFRLPGEAQCIDRLMEAFASQLYCHQSIAVECQRSPIGTSLENSDCNQISSQTESLAESTFFKSSDGIYVLAFSTIMLNTDLHSPMIKEDKRMTLEQFLYNNRGINDGDDFPTSFMTALYYQIKDSEIQVQGEITDDLEFRQWEGILNTKSKEVAAPIFTNNEIFHDRSTLAGVHERDMFLSLAPSALQTFSSMFVRTKDRGFMGKLVNGMRQILIGSIYFGLKNLFNDALIVLLEFGKDYIGDVFNSVLSEMSGDSTLVKDQVVLISEQPVEGKNENTAIDASSRLIEEKGLVALESAFQLLTSYSHSLKFLREGLPLLIECICLLRDLDVLPSEFSELDDFADSDGSILSPSPFSCRSFCRAQSYYNITYGLNDEIYRSSSWSISSFFQKATSSTRRYMRDISEDATWEDFINHYRLNSGRLMPQHSDMIGLMKVKELKKLDVILSSKQNKDCTKQICFALLEGTRMNDQIPVLIFEHQAAYCLEIAARLLFNNMAYAQELYPLFLTRFKDALVYKNEIPDNPYLVERMVVSILRCSIHMIDSADLRHMLMSSLSLVTALPIQFLRQINDRLSCATAILLHSSLQQLTTEDEWQLINKLIELSIITPVGCSFIFDGVTSCTRIIYREMMKNENSDEDFVSVHGIVIMIRVLLKMSNNHYGTMPTAGIEAISCLDKLYPLVWHISQGKSLERYVPDQDMWLSICKTCYNISLEVERDEADFAITTLERIVLSNHTDYLSVSSWFKLLYTLVSVEHSSSHETIRVKVFRLICKVLLIVLPQLGSSEVQDVELLKLISTHAQKNLGHSKDSVTYEVTVECLTNTINVLNMMALEMTENSPTLKIYIDTFTTELQRVHELDGLLK